MDTASLRTCRVHYLILMPTEDLANIRQPVSKYIFYRSKMTFLEMNSLRLRQFTSSLPLHNVLT